MSFLCSLDNFLLKIVIFFFFGNQISKWCSFEKKKAFLTYFSHFLVTTKQTQTFLHHISHLHTYTYFSRPIDFFASPILQRKKKKKERKKKGKNTNLSCMVSLWGGILVLIPICAIFEQSIKKNKKNGR